MPSPPVADPVRWGRVFAALVFVGLVVEVTMQAFLYRWSGERYRSLNVNIFSPYGLVRNNPDLTSVSYKINANGLRNVGTFTQKKPPHTLRVMILGGSVMYSGLGGTPMPGVERVDSKSTIAQYLETELRADPALAGLDIEVLNAAVNFNTIKEVSAGYLAEWLFWDADFVVYGASANNFAYAPRKGLIASREWGIQGPHPWEGEFRRIGNEHTPEAFAERGVSTLEASFASVAVLRKGVTLATDTAFLATANRAAALGILRPPAAAPFEPDSFEEWDAYINEYLGYAEAMVVAARRHHQNLSFLWEYLLASLGGIKPMGATERWLYEQNRRPTYAIDAVYDARARDGVRSFCEGYGVPFLDPLERLKTYDGLVFIDYLHYTREGNQFMARFVYASLRDAIHERARRLRAEGR